MTRDQSKLYDVRTLERNLRKGLLSKKDYDKYLKALPDVEQNAAVSKPDESREIEYPVEEPPPSADAATGEDEAQEPGE